VIPDIRTATQSRRRRRKKRLTDKSPVYIQCLKNFKTRTTQTDVGKKGTVYLLSSSYVLVMNTVCSSNNDSHQSRIPFLHIAVNVPVTKLGPGELFIDPYTIGPT
jgi:hypothetical protein